jgi:uncharacterized protein YgbK (DUF1537 family)
VTIVLGCIADDFTGATDIAALLARSGATVCLRIGVPADSAAAADAFEVIALKIRTAPADQAAGQAQKALKWLQGAGARRFFWKYCSTFDSTARGNIGPVAEALMEELAAEQTIYCPAFPENDRSVYMGHLFVGTQLLSESPMKNHPLTPMQDANLVRLLTAQVTKPVALVDHRVVSAGQNAIRAELAALKSRGVAHVIVDAIDNRCLENIARACHDLALLTGSSAMAMQLPAIYAQQGLLAAEPFQAQMPALGTGCIVLSGSCSAMTRRQVAAFLPQSAAYKLNPLVLSQEGCSAASKWLTSQPPGKPRMIYATADPEEVLKAQQQLGVHVAGSLVEEAFAHLARQARDQGVHRFVVAGGETAGAVIKALAVTRLTIGKEIAPGVPWTFGQSEGRNLALALKSGNFGAEDFFQAAFDLLEDL